MNQFAGGSAIDVFELDGGVVNMKSLVENLIQSH